VGRFHTIGLHLQVVCRFKGARGLIRPDSPLPPSFMSLRRCTGFLDWMTLVVGYLFLLLFHFLTKDRTEVNLGVSVNWVAESSDIGGGFLFGRSTPQTQIRNSW
jgi:hypothetical protein